MNNDVPYVTVVIPAHNEEDYIERCLTSILAQDYPDSRYETIVVNNNSTDATPKIARQLGVQVIDEPQGPVGRVRNAGAKAARGEVLLFIDSDCIAPSDWITYAAGKISSEPGLVLGGGCELPQNPKPIEKYWLLNGTEGATLPRDLIGASIAIATSDFFEVGGFDESVTSGEDSKLSATLRKQGFLVSIEREMSVIHLGNATSYRDFIQRQIWHSENYIKDLQKSIFDPTFILTATFLTLLLLASISLPFSPRIAFLTALIAAIIPLIFSTKRIRRANTWHHLKNLPQIYLVDFSYLLGRSAGILKGIKRRSK
ncbi:glycosyltransferase [Marinobacter sp. AN1]|uniref:glycosyltransferase n=1 Tax=Marinobacter sp. AN1 TaxID=2886046 RepID=UPI00222FD516|nr:glycosyltransferase [Marinobacter sp. AN1]UZD66515.1 glycosyltransferase [Marinobacter sp. AN1]